MRRIHQRPRAVEVRPRGRPGVGDAAVEGLGKVEVEGGDFAGIQ